MAHLAPAFLTMILMPLTFSISKGLVAGFIAWPICQVAAGKGREVHPFIYGLAAALIVAAGASFLI